MENLSEDLLIEIWIRVPCKIAVRSKSISKRFLTFISSPQFIERWIHHHHTLLRHMKEEDQLKQWQLNCVSMGNFLISFFPTLHQNQFIPGPGPRPRPTIDHPRAPYTRILGSSSGLLLCQNSEQDRLYFICNPVTKDWVELPPLAAFTVQNQRGRALEGFLCEPYYHVEGNTNSNRVTINPDTPRFRVVRIPCLNASVNKSRYKFEVVVFSSETGEWSTKLVSCPKGFTRMNIWVAAAAHEGKLYFMGKRSVMVYDPFNSEEQCDTIDYPTDLSQRRCHVGVSCGNLRICSVFGRTTTRDGRMSTRISVWELEQEKEWRLVHKTCLPRNEMRVCVRAELGSVGIDDLVAAGVQVRGFHPYHGDVVFFQRAHRIFVGNLKTNKFDTVGYGIFGFQSLQPISLDLPWWPTPLPSITT